MKTTTNVTSMNPCRVRCLALLLGAITLDGIARDAQAQGLNPNPGVIVPGAKYRGSGPKQLAAGSASAFPKNIEQLLNCQFNGNVAALARFLAVNRYSILAWKGGVHRPTLLSLADLS